MRLVRCLFERILVVINWISSHSREPQSGAIIQREDRYDGLHLAIN